MPEPTSGFLPFLSGLSDWLKWGPIGLAGLMLVLVIATLARPIDKLRAQVLTRFQYVGAFCFVVACIFALISSLATHTLVVTVLPFEEDIYKSLSKPKVTANKVHLLDPNTPYNITENITAIVDVSSTLNEMLRGLDSQNKELEKQRGALAKVEENATKLQTVATGLQSENAGVVKSIAQNIQAAVSSVPQPMTCFEYRALNNNQADVACNTNTAAGYYWEVLNPRIGVYHEGGVTTEGNPACGPGMVDQAHGFTARFPTFHHFFEDVGTSLATAGPPHPESYDCDWGPEYKNMCGQFAAICKRQPGG